MTLSRRDTLKIVALGLPLPLVSSSADPAAIAKRPAVPFRGLRIGLASYSTRKLSVEQTIALCRRVDIRFITLKSSHLPLDSTREQRREIRKKFRDAGIEVAGCGVIYMKTPEEIRRALDYAQDLGANTVVAGIGEPMVGNMEKAIRDFDLRVAIHNHGPKDKLGAFSPLEVWNWIQGADKKIGVCMDVGHTFRCGHEPSEVARKCRARLYDVHMKDLDASLSSVPVGQGTIDIIRLLKTLLKLGYQHQVALEYEADRDDPATGIADSIGFQRGVLATL
ncbi:MAG: sugar phosphate isomerase/epimerase family protein [Bryobacteraceae bacterium]